MSIYAEVKDNILISYPYTLGSLFNENPYTNFGPDPDFVSIFPSTETAINNNYTLVPVTILPEPTFDPSTQKCTQNTQPTLINGIWTLDWTVSNLTPEEKTAVDANKAAEVRTDRDNRLTASDWTQLPDAPVDKTAWQTYRQTLRNIPQSAGFPWNVNWPVQPIVT